MNADRPRVSKGGNVFRPFMLCRARLILTRLRMSLRMEGLGRRALIWGDNLTTIVLAGKINFKETSILVRSSWLNVDCSSKFL